MTMNFSSLIKLAAPVLATVIADLPATTPAYIMILLKILSAGVGQFAGNVGMKVGTHTAPISDLPPEEEWSPATLKAYAQKKAGESHSA